MNTNALKRFAKEARIKLLGQVSRKLEYVLTHDTAELRGKQKEIAQLKKKIIEQGKEQVIEMVAYTWFNRLMALRFMDANGYTIPKVITPVEGMTNPEILQNALGGNIEPELKLDRQRLNDLLDGKTAATDAHTEAYKMLLVASCNQWHTAMPFMFERISDYTELLLPDDLLSDYSIVADVREGMSDEDCQQEELIGWLYQFYIADKKDGVFEGLKKNIKITAENIPAATQLFTPRWIVRYMVENTLGKLWLTLKPNSKLRQFMPYYIEAPEGNAPAPVPDDLNPLLGGRGVVTDITFLDPCQGSGHVLVYAFDLFTKIYEEEGYNTNEIPALILEHNLFGIDIDQRAAQLAAFALTMKARSYYPRFLRKPVPPHVIALENVRDETIRQSVNLPITIHGKKISDYKDLSLHLLTQADNFGSLIQINPEEVKAINIQEGSIWQEQEQKLKEQAEFLSKQYHCVVTNPPYLGGGGMNNDIKIFLEKYYPKSKSDLMACFIEACLAFNSKNGKTGMINQHGWMFLSSYDELRPKLLREAQFENMLHLGPRTFPEIAGEVVQNTSFVFGKYQSTNNSVYIQLTEYDNSILKEKKTLEAISCENCDWVYHGKQKEFERIPGMLLGYWLNEEQISAIEKGNDLFALGKTRRGLQPGNSPRFIRKWFEVSHDKFQKPDKKEITNSSSKKWFVLNSGGEFRKWYGNLNTVVNWEHLGKEIKDTGKAIIPSEHLYFEPAIVWNKIASNLLAFRFQPEGIIPGDASPAFFALNHSDIKFLLGQLNSKILIPFLKLYAPTQNAQVGDIGKIPIRKSDEGNIEYLVDQLIELSKKECELYETDWSFTSNELISCNNNGYLKKSVIIYSNKTQEIFHNCYNLEKQLNKAFISIYNLEEKMTGDFPIKEITLFLEERIFMDGKFQIKPSLILTQFLSYSIGCLFGRYSLDKPGLILANQGETLQDFLKQVPNPTFMPDEDNIIPVLDGEWFTDDIVGRFKAFLKAAFGEENFEENIKYIEDTIGKDIRKYFVKDFYNDHIKRYKKRPIYWMFSSPKGHFKALIYMHRYQPDLCSKMLNDYLQAFISKLEAAKQTQTMLSLREDISAREKTIAIKEIDKYEAMLKDCREYEKTLFTIATQKISIDLDDGVKVNYQKFKEVLVPIKGLEKEEE